MWKAESRIRLCHFQGSVRRHVCKVTHHPVPSASFLLLNKDSYGAGGGQGHQDGGQGLGLVGQPGVRASTSGCAGPVHLTPTHLISGQFTDLNLLKFPGKFSVCLMFRCIGMKMCTALIHAAFMIVSCLLFLMRKKSFTRAMSHSC